MLVQKSCGHQLRLVVFPINFIHPRWLAGFLPTVSLGGVYTPLGEHMWEVKLPSPGIPAFEKRDELFQPTHRWVHDGWFLEGFLAKFNRNYQVCLLPFGGLSFFPTLGVFRHTCDFFSVVKKETYDSPKICFSNTAGYGNISPCAI